MDNLKQALKPCPFCGGEPKWCDDDSYGECWVVCHCEVEPNAHGPKDDPEYTVKLWNTRATLSVGEDDVERADLLRELACFRDGLDWPHELSARAYMLRKPQLDCIIAALTAASLARAALSALPQSQQEKGG